MSSVESQKILAAYNNYKSSIVNRNNKEKFQQQLAAAKARATATLNKLQSQYAPSQQVRQNFRTLEEINEARQRALAEVAANPPSSGGGSSPSNFQQQAQDFYNRQMPTPPTQTEPAPTVGTIIRQTDTLLQRLPEIPTTREEYNAIYKKLSDAREAYAVWKSQNSKKTFNRPYYGWSPSYNKARREVRNHNRSYDAQAAKFQAAIRSAQVHWDQTSRGSREIEVHIKALLPYLDLESFTRPEIASALTAITAASNSISRIISQKQFVERARLSELQKLMLLVTNKRAEEIKLSAAAMGQTDFQIIQSGGQELIQTIPPSTVPPEGAAPQGNDLGTQLGEAIKGAFGGSQEGLNRQALMVARANIEAAKILAGEEQ